MVEQMPSSAIIIRAYVIELWRTDIHGNDFFMRRFVDVEEAEGVRQEFEDRGHHQTYWLRRVDNEDPPEPVPPRERRRT